MIHQDNASQETTNSTWPTEVDMIQSQGSQSQAIIMMTTDTMMIDGARIPYTVLYVQS